MSDFALNPAVDPGALGARLAETGRLHLPRFLADQSAEEVGEILRSERGWYRSVHLKSGSFSAPLDGEEPIEAKHREWLDAAVLDGAAGQMQYIYDSRRLSSEKRFGLARGDRLEAFESFLNGEAVLGFMRRLTGDDRITSCEAQATRFFPGHALTAHSDNDGKGARLYAFVLNFTRPWRPDWGGLLLFHGSDGHVEQGFTPGFNSLNVFRVPMAHAVSQVASFAQAPRLAISGWFQQEV